MDRDSLSKTLMNLYDLVARLRGPGGCPWDARQTYRTVRMYLLEEAYEALDAIEGEKPREICQELGDLLFQIIFLAYMGEEKGEFDLQEVMAGIHEKMIRRHPHVFGSSKVESAEEVSLNWARIKEKERAESTEPSSPLESVPSALPSLLRAHRLGERASKTGLFGADAGDLWVRIRETFESLQNLDPKRDAPLVREKMGSLFFDLANLARDWGFNAEDLLRETNRRFFESLRRPKEELDG